MAVDGICLNLSTVFGPESTLGRDLDALDAGTAERPCFAGREEAVPKDEIGLKIARFSLATFTWLEAENCTQREVGMRGMRDARRNKSSQVMLLMKVYEFSISSWGFADQQNGSKSRETVCKCLEYISYETSMAYFDSFSIR